jgi:putative DNA primase/helicase
MFDIKALQEQMLAHGIAWDNPSLDGKIYRFGDKKKHWAIGWQNHTSEGKIYLVAQYGDWSLGEIYDYKTARRYNKQEKEIISKQIKKAQKQQQEERKNHQEQARDNAEKIWESGVENMASDYLKRKGIEKLYGTKTALYSKGRVVLVPTRRIDGTLTGLQQIFPNGSKYFLEGQEIKNCCHKIGEINETIYVCEGFATAVTLHKATEEAVFCSFNSSNLVSLCRLLREKYRDKGIIVCGDDDSWNIEKNPGKEAAEEAAKACLGKACFPNFKDTSDKPTDFNDLEQQEGLNEVKRQVLSIEPEKKFIKALGHKDDFYFYTSSENKQIVKISVGQHDANHLLNLMPMTYWETLYPKQNSDFDVKSATNDLMKQARLKGFFNESLVRGVGVWPNCVNTGTNLWLEGRSIALHATKDRYIYKIGEKISPPDSKLLSVDEGIKLQKALSALSWSRTGCAELFAGWLVLAPMCGSLNWRPHIWLTGSSGVGKSYLMSKLIDKVLPFRVFFNGATTEAGIRQEIGCDAKPLIFDEFETDDEKSGERVKVILELFRQASSETQGKIVKGSASGQSIAYQPRFCALVSSIRVNLTTEADKNRFTVCELARSESNRFGVVQSAFGEIMEGFSQRLFNRTYKLFPVIEQNIKTLSTMIGQKYNQRFGDQYGTLLAGYASLNGENALSKKEAEGLLGNVDFDGFSDVINETDESDCEEHLFKTRISVDVGFGRQEKTLLELILTKKVVTGGDTQTALAQYGITLKDSDIFVAQSHPELRKIFRGTKWFGGWSKSLARISGAEIGIQKKILKKNTKCVKIPISALISD